MERLLVRASTPYEVLIGKGLLKNTGKRLEEAGLNHPKIGVICDSNVDPLYGDEVVGSCRRAERVVERFVFPAGEQAKSVEMVEKIIDWLCEKQFTRTDLLVALGGGVCGDLVGFVAAIYLRGVDFVQIPTTFLSAIDSSVGGKTAINIPQGKNLVGAFWQPRLVICDTDTLETLTEEVYTDGIAEAIKYGAIGDRGLFELLGSQDWRREGVASVILRCVEMKAKIVEADERDGGIRQILNFGHTLGHGIEKLSNLEISHGRGVAIGMCLVTKAGEAAGFTKAGTAEEIERVLQVYGLPTTTEYSVEELVAASLGDKKRAGDRIAFILLEEIGSWLVEKTPLTQLGTFVKGGM